MTSELVQVLFVDLALITVLARVFGAVAARLRQPPVVGEILAGILLGPTLLPAAVTEVLFPDQVRPLLAALATVGIAWFMFAVGLEIEHQAVRASGRATLGAVIGSVLVPFVLGIGLGLLLLRQYPSSHPAAFVVFLGLTVSVTAFPVLARIIGDRGLARTALGGIALATAAAVDVVAWIGLAAVQAWVGSDDGNWRVALMVPYVAAMVFGVRPLLRRLLIPGGTYTPLSVLGLAVVLSGALLSGAATEAMGTHFFFGAFLFGLLMPWDATNALRADLRSRTDQLTSLLLPVFFVVAGLQVNLRGLGWSGLLLFVAILAVAVTGKLGGTYLGARLQGMPKRPAAALATLMNTRGLTELIILEVGLRAGLLSGSLYSLMVVMALVTTAMTGPLIAIIYRRPVEIAPNGVPDATTLAPAQAPTVAQPEGGGGNHAVR